MNFTDEQMQALRVLAAALTQATECGALDELQANVDNPDSINDVCDAVAYTLGETK